MSIAATRPAETEHSLPNCRWIISEGLRSRVGEHLYERCLDLLDRLGIPHRIISNPQQWQDLTKTPLELSLIHPEIDLLNTESTADVLWRDSLIQINIITTTNGSNRLFVQPNRQTSLHALDEETLLSLRNAIDLATGVFKEVTGTTDHTEVLWQSDDKMGFELCPCFSFTPDSQDNIVDILRKSHRNMAILSKGRIGSYTIPTQFILPLKGAILEAAANRTSTDQRQEHHTPLPVNYITRGWNATGRFGIHALLQYWNRLGLPVTSAPVQPDDSSPAEFPNNRENAIRACIFCSPRMRENETLAKTDLAFVASNFRPYTGRREQNSRHVLVITNRQIENSADATQEERLAIHELIKKTIEAGKRLYPSAEARVFVQQGLNAGQTVPHFHAHVIFVDQQEESERGGLSESGLSQYLSFIAQDTTGTLDPTAPQPSPQLAALLNQSLATQTARAP